MERTSARLAASCLIMWDTVLLLMVRRQHKPQSFKRFRQPLKRLNTHTRDRAVHDRDVQDFSYGPTSHTHIDFEFLGESMKNKCVYTI